MIKIHVYRDGDIELTKVNEKSPKHIVFTDEQIKNGELLKELLDYGLEESQAQEAVQKSLELKVHESFIAN